METRSEVHTLKKICVSAGKCSEAVLIKTFDAAFKAARREVSERLVGGEKVLTHIQRSAGSREEDIGRYRAQRGLDLGKETHMAWRQGTECTFAIWGSWTRQNGSYVLLMFLEAGRAELAAGIKELHDSETQRGKKKKKILTRQFHSSGEKARARAQAACLTLKSWAAWKVESFAAMSLTLKLFLGTE